jgi:hypothetical protein
MAKKCRKGCVIVFKQCTFRSPDTTYLPSTGGQGELTCYKLLAEISNDPGFPGGQLYVA